MGAWENFLTLLAGRPPRQKESSHRRSHKSKGLSSSRPDREEPPSRELVPSKDYPREPSSRELVPSKDHPRESSSSSGSVPSREGPRESSAGLAPRREDPGESSSSSGQIGIQGRQVSRLGVRSSIPIHVSCWLTRNCRNLSSGSTHTRTGCLRGLSGSSRKKDRSLVMVRSFKKALCASISHISRRHHGGSKPAPRTVSLDPSRLSLPSRSATHLQAASRGYDHVKRSSPQLARIDIGLAGSFCGYRNIQMLISHIIGAQKRGHEAFGETFPSIFEIQDLIENAWDMGLHAQGRIETGGVRGTRKYIGTPEVYTQHPPTMHTRR